MQRLPHDRRGRRVRLDRPQPDASVSDVADERVAGMSAVAYVTQSIREPQAFTVTGFGAGVMPTFELSDAEVESLVAFLLTER